MKVEILSAGQAPEPNIMPQLLRQAINEIRAEGGYTLAKLAQLIPMDQGDLEFWMNHERLDRSWYRHVDREVERFAVQWAADRKHKNRKVRKGRAVMAA